jgi:hypothetical protein
MSIYDEYGYDPTADSNPALNGSVSDPITSSGATGWSGLTGLLGSIASPIAAAALGQSNVNAATADRSALQTAAIDHLQQLANSLRDSSANPDLQQYVANAARAVELGQLQPAQAFAAVQEQSNLNGIKLPQQYQDAINSTLSQLDTVSKQGYTDIEKAAVQKALNQSLVQARGEIGQARTEAQERGQYGTGSQLVSQQMASQAAANTASQNALDIQAAGLKRALDALAAKGTLGLQASDQSFNQQKTIASAQDQINAQNALLRQQANEANAARVQQAATVNNQNKYHVQDQNIAQQNLEQDRARAAAQAQFDNAQRQRELAAQVDVAAGRNASSILNPVYQQQQAARTAQNQQAGNALSGANIGSLIGGVGNLVSNVPWGSIGSGIADFGSSIGSAIGDIFSDEDVKENKQKLSDDDLDSIFDKLVPTQFTYKKSVQRIGAPGGSVTGVMAQDLEKTPQGAMIVIDSPNGKKLDGQKALSLALAALSSQNNRIKALEGK